MAPSSIPAAPAPWRLRATTYSFMMYISSSTAAKMAPLIYSPLESASHFSSGTPQGGLAMVQVIRYSESPVGPYDELLLIPGSFEYQRPGDAKPQSNLRVTRIYVSQKDTCWNGRKNWNIPKHLARFSFESLADGGTSIAVYPHDTAGDTMETNASTSPFFTAKYRPISYIPAFPLSMGILKYFSVDLHLVQPPLPEGRGSQRELAGTDRWCKVMPKIYGKKCSLGWWDLQQHRNSTGRHNNQDINDIGYGKDTNSMLPDNNANWWPDIGRWRLGLKMEEATIEFSEGEHWRG